MLAGGVGNKVPERAAAGRSRAKLPRADVEAGRVEDDQPRVRGRVRRAGPRCDEQHRDLADALRCAPAVELAHGVGSHDEVELTLAAQGLEGIDRVRRALAIELERGDLEARLVGGRESEHRETVLLRRDGATVLQRRPAGRDEDHAIERDALEGCLGDREMADMHRIERAAEDADPAHSPASFHSSSSAPMRTVSPSFTPCLRSSRSTPARASMRWKYALASGLVQSIPPASRSTRSPFTRKPSGTFSTIHSLPEPLNAIRLSAVAAGATAARSETRENSSLFSASTPSPLAADIGRAGSSDRLSSASFSREIGRAHV